MARVVQRTCSCFLDPRLQLCQPLPVRVTSRGMQLGQPPATRAITWPRSQVRLPEASCQPLGRAPERQARPGPPEGKFHRVPVSLLRTQGLVPRLRFLTSLLASAFLGR